MKNCPKCGSSFAEESASGLCPACLLRDLSGVEANFDLFPSGGGRLHERIRCFGEYELIEELGRGGMGVVYKARQMTLDRHVALKMIVAGGFAPTHFVERFRTEARAIASLDHPNIVPLYEVGEYEGQQYFTMKLVEGVTLSRYAAPERLPIREAVRLLSKLSRAVHFAHQHGILHRDLKPANILVDSAGEPFIVDFGLAKALEENTAITHTGILGTPAYMAPEQIQTDGKVMTTGVDVYSLGAILYELLTGRPPFAGESAVVILQKALQETAQSPRQLRPEVDRDLETICVKCLEKEREARYGSAEALAQDLDCFLNSRPIFARPSSALERCRKWAAREPARAGMAALSVVALIGVIVSLSIINRLRTKQKEALREVANQLQLTLLREHTVAYCRNIALAQRELLAGNVAEANDILEACRPNQARNWEWYYLKRQCTRQKAVKIALHANGLSYLSYLADGRTLAAGLENDQAMQGVLRFFNANTGDEEKHSPTENILTQRATDLLESFVLDTEGTVFPTNSKRLSRFQLRELTSGEVIFPKMPVLHQRLYTPKQIAFHPHQKLLALITADLGAIVFDLDGHIRLQTRAIEAAYPPVFTQKGDRIAMVGLSGTSVGIWSVGPEQQVKRLPHEGKVNVIRFSPDGAFLAAASANGGIYFWETRTERLVHLLLGHNGEVFGLSFNHDGTRLASCGDDKSVKIWDTTSGQELLSIPTESPKRVAFSPDGQHLAIGTGDGEILILSGEKGRSPAKTINTQSLINLTAFYNGRHTDGWHFQDGNGRGLSALPTGIIRFGDVDFDVHGVIQLSGKQLNVSFPERVNGIKLGQKGRRIHFLHSTGWVVPEGTQIAKFVVHYANGDRRNIPVVYGADLREWHGRSDTKNEITRGALAWSSSDASKLRLYTSTWTNPAPGVEMSKIDYVSTMTDCFPFLLAISLE